MDYRVDGVNVCAAEGSLCGADGQHIARRSSVTDFSGRVDRRLFAVDARPPALRLLYVTCVTSPADVIAQCDIYRTDGKIGAAIFSVPIVSINERPSEDYLTVIPAAAVRPLLCLTSIILSVTHRVSKKTVPVLFSE